MQDEIVLYNGHSVSKNYFRAFVYGRDDKKKLANSWQEFQELIGSGLWFVNIDDIPKKRLKVQGQGQKNGTNGS